MNDYFRRTPKYFDYDNTRYPGEGDLYDLRVATQIEANRLRAEIRLTDNSVANILEAVTKLIDDVSEAQDRIEALEAKATSPEPVRSLDMSAIIGVLKVYADPEMWQFTTRCGGAHFKNAPMQPWELARLALKDAGEL